MQVAVTFVLEMEVNLIVLVHLDINLQQMVKRARKVRYLFPELLLLYY